MTTKPEALQLANELETKGKALGCSFDRHSAELRRLGPENTKQAEQLKALTHLVRQLHQAKGRYHTQNALCALFDAFGLENTKPEKR